MVHIVRKGFLKPVNDKNYLTCLAKRIAIVLRDEQQLKLRERESPSAAQRVLVSATK